MIVPRAARRIRRVKFSMIFEAQTHDTSRKAEFQLMHDCVEQAVLAEELGFDRVWAVEHHCLEWYAHMSAPETFLAYVAAKTRRIRIGHGVVWLAAAGADEIMWAALETIRNLGRRVLPRFRRRSRD
jgi:hypothetical protein